MSVECDAKLIVGWPIELADGVDGEDFLNPICKPLKCEYVWSGNAFSGESYGRFIRMNQKDELSFTQMEIILDRAKTVETALKKAGLKIGFFSITTATLVA